MASAAGPPNYNNVYLGDTFISDLRAFLKERNINFQLSHGFGIRAYSMLQKLNCENRKIEQLLDMVQRRIEYDFQRGSVNGESNALSSYMHIVQKTTIQNEAGKRLSKIHVTINASIFDLPEFSVPLKPYLHRDIYEQFLR
jgi:hypothetical protein